MNTVLMTLDRKALDISLETYDDLQDIHFEEYRSSIDNVTGYMVTSDNFKFLFDKIRDEIVSLDIVGDDKGNYIITVNNYMIFITDETIEINNCLSLLFSLGKHRKVHLKRLVFSKILHQSVISTKWLTKESLYETDKHNVMKLCYDDGVLDIDIVGFYEKRYTLKYKDMIVKAAGLLLYQKDGDDFSFLLQDGMFGYEDVGGKVESYDKTVYDTVIRETLEETNGVITADDISEIFHTKNVYYDRKGGYLLFCIPATRKYRLKEFGHVELSNGRKRKFRWMQVPQLNEHKLNGRISYIVKQCILRNISNL
jgi:hypothetical protein